MVGYVSVPLATLPAVFSSWLSGVRSLFTSTLPADFPYSGMCVYPELTAMGKALLSGALPLAVGAAMVIVLLLKTALLHLHKRCAAEARGLSESSAPWREHLLEPTHVTGDPDSHAVMLDARLHQTGDASDDYGEESAGMQYSSSRSKYIAAGLNFFLSVYSSFLVTVVAMLHCVDIPGASRGLFLQGSVQCDYSGWQLPFVIVSVVLVAVPLITPFLTSWAVTYQHEHQLSIQSIVSLRTVKRSRGWRDDLCYGVILALVTPYDSSMGWWESVMVLHRATVSLPRSQSRVRVHFRIFFPCDPEFALHAVVYWIPSAAFVPPAVPSSRITGLANCPADISHYRVYDESDSRGYSGLCGCI